MTHPLTYPLTHPLVVIGTSSGGLTALKAVLSELPEQFPAAVVVVQHRHKESGGTLSQFLQHYLALPIKDVEDKDPLHPGQIYLAPADYHVLIQPDYLSLSTDEPVSFARPSIDVLFESAADTYREKTIGVLLTGANHDGAQGLARIKAAGGVTLVQDPATAESRIMPQAAIDLFPVDQVLHLSAIAPTLVSLCSAQSVNPPRRARPPIPS